MIMEKSQYHFTVIDGRREAKERELIEKLFLATITSEDVETLSPKGKLTLIASSGPELPSEQ